MGCLPDSQKIAPQPGSAVAMTPRTPAVAHLCTSRRRCLIIAAFPTQAAVPTGEKTDAKVGGEVGPIPACHSRVRPPRSSIASSRAQPMASQRDHAKTRASAKAANQA